MARINFVALYGDDPMTGGRMLYDVVVENTLGMETEFHPLADILPGLYEIEKKDGEVVLKSFGDLEEADFDEYYGITKEFGDEDTKDN